MSLQAALQYILSPRATSLRSILQQEALTAADLLLRQAARKAYSRTVASLPSNPFSFLPLPPLPSPTELPLPVLLPTALASEGDVPTVVPVLASAAQLLEAVRVQCPHPPLTCRSPLIARCSRLNRSSKIRERRLNADGKGLGLGFGLGLGLGFGLRGSPGKSRLVGQGVHHLGVRAAPF